MFMYIRKYSNMIKGDNWLYELIILFILKICKWSKIFERK